MQMYFHLSLDKFRWSLPCLEMTHCCPWCEKFWSSERKPCEDELWGCASIHKVWKGTIWCAEATFSTKATEYKPEIYVGKMRKRKISFLRNIWNNFLVTTKKVKQIFSHLSSCAFCMIHQSIVNSFSIFCCHCGKMLAKNWKGHLEVLSLLSHALESFSFSDSKDLFFQSLSE